MTSFKRSRTASSISSNGSPASMNRGTSKPFAKIFRQIGPLIWPKPKTNCTTLSKHAAARAPEIHSHCDRKPTSECAPSPPPTAFLRVLASTPAPAPSLTPTAQATARFQTATPSLVGLEALIARIRLPDEGLDQFLVTLRRAVDDVGTAHPELLRLVLPYREFINGEEGLSTLRHNLERIQIQKTNAQSCDAS